MVRWTRSALIARGKGIQALQWAKEITDWANKKYNSQMKVYMDYFGENGTLRWFVDYEDLTTFEKISNQIFGDQEYWQKLTQAADLFVEGSGFDTIMREI
jgi:hypothetical protein